MLTPKNLKKY